MDTMTAYAMGAASRTKECMVFDWDKAARLIVERGAVSASAGLAGDWEWTGDKILSHGKPDEDCGAYLASTWATPELEIDGDTVECFRMASDTPGWHANTRWPESALAILAGPVTKDEE